MSKTKKTTKKINEVNIGMNFENEISSTNDIYESEGIALIRKIPTPIKVTAIKGAMITRGFFESRSALDFNGILKSGTHIDFDVKSTKSKTSFPFMSNRTHQLEYMEKIEDLNGIAFYLIKFELHDRYFLITYRDIKVYLFLYPEKKSIHFGYLEEELKDNEVFRVNKDGVWFVDYIGTLEKLGMVSL